MFAHRCEMSALPTGQARSSVLALAVLVGSLALWGCGIRATAPTPTPGRPFVETGLASWYGEPFHGRTTASGERYDMWAMTAAHRTLPFGTVVRVRRTDTGQETTVRITDRGPFVRGRIIDLSRAAAEALNAVGPGVVPVRIRVESWGGEVHSSSCWEVQVGAFSRAENVQRARRKLESRGYSVRTLPGRGGTTRVRITNVGNRQQAADVVRRVRRDFPEARPVQCGGS